MSIKLKIIIVSLGLCLISMAVYALDYPHSPSNSYDCANCHDLFSGNPFLMPDWTGDYVPIDADDTPLNHNCRSCHFGGGPAPAFNTHSYLGVGYASAGDSRYGPWQVECSTCHDPHYQKQFSYYSDKGETYWQFKSLIDTVTASAAASTLKAQSSPGWAVDEYKGLIVIPDINARYPEVFKITGNNSDTLTIKGEIIGVSNGDTFAIVYGKLVRHVIDLDRITNPMSLRSGDSMVRFFDASGTNSFADGAGQQDGPCEVCHQETTYHLNDGKGSSHNEGADCMRCHAHNNGFVHGGSGTGCIECHGHDSGTLYDPDMTSPYAASSTASLGAGTSQSHSTHTETDSDDKRGPGIYCSTCHDINNFPYFKTGSGAAPYDFSETDVCDTCHSADGTYDGIDDSVIGAKNNWSDGIYTGSSLTAGKEKWCAGCHDESASVISSVTAPNVIGDEDGSYIYGTGWGYYKTGHGLDSGEAYGYKGIIVEPTLINGAARPIGCLDCHDSTISHIDGDRRTFNDLDSATTSSTVYQQGYRLKLVGGQEPMDIPWQAGGPVVPNTTDRYRLCTGCHEPTIYTTTSTAATNFVTGGINRHNYHLEQNQLRYQSDWNGSLNSRMNCVACHNVHGSKQLSMIRDGSLLDQEAGQSRTPGQQIWYYNDEISVVALNNPDPPDPQNVPLSASTGTVWIGNSSSNLCSYCHANANTAIISRTPFQTLQMSPTLAFTGETGYVSDGADPDSASASSTFEFRVKYTDVNNDAPSSIQLWLDSNDVNGYEAAEKHGMTEVNASDANYTDGKIFSYFTEMPKDGDNTFDYRFYASDGTDTVEFPTAPDLDGSVAVTNNSPALSWTGEAYYEDFGVNPVSGKQGESFVFRTTYTDQDNECPAGGGSDIQIWIDENDDGYDAGEKHNLNAADGDADCTDGKIYTLTKVLSATGSHNYRFNASDGTDTATGDVGPVSDNIVTVLSSTNNPPRLDWVTEACLTNGVKPVKGLETGDFLFKVKYTDPDNECPISPSDIQVVVDGTSYDLDQNDAAACDEGRTYYTTLQLSTAGDFAYYFYAMDGTDIATGGPVSTSGNEVTVVSMANALGVRTGTGDTDPWYNSIQAAVDKNVSDTTIYVYDGTYNENVTINDSPDTDEGITLEAVCGAEHTKIIASSGDAVFIQNINTYTIIDGFTIDGATSGISINNGNVTVRNNIIENNTQGINSSNPANVLTLEDTIIRDNSGGSVEGAGVKFNGGGPHSITGSTITNNVTSGPGGGIHVQNGSGLTISDTTINGNSAGGNGGGIFHNNLVLSIDKTSITFNTSSTTGGGLFLQGGGTTTLTNCSITGNIANIEGGGLKLNSHTTSFTNCTVSGNNLTDTSNGKGGGLYANNSTTNIKNSIFWNNKASVTGSGHEAYTVGNTVTFTYSDVPDNANALNNGGSGGFSVDSTNVEANPLFVGGSPFDYHLKSISPLIDQGTSTGAPSDDIDGESRDASPDIGCDEYSSVGPDTEQPVVTGFTAFTPSTDRNVPVTLFTATDNIGVAGYMITTSAVPPSSGNSGWAGTAPATYLLISDGTHTLYPWAKDAAGNVSGVYESPATVVVDAAAPTVTAFTATTPTNNLNIPITIFTASDVVGVTGYKITESATPPSAGGGGWTGIAPTAYTVGSAGTYTLYPWAKDAVGNVSSVYGSPQTVEVDTTAPQVSSTLPDDNDTGVVLNSTVTINWDEDVDCTTVNTSNLTIDQHDWTKTSCSGSQAVFTPDSQTISTTYTVTVSTSVKDAAGNPMASNYVFSYETAGSSNNPPALLWTSANCLTDGVRPRTGADSTEYQFRVVYSDSDGDAPDYVKVNINGSVYDLTNHDSGNLVTGRIYWEDINNTPLTSAGDYYYYYTAQDSNFADATGDPTQGSTYQVSVLNGVSVRPSGTSLTKDYTSINTAANAVSGNVVVYPDDDFTSATYSERVIMYNKDNRTIQSACGADLTILSSNTGGDTILPQDSGNFVVDGLSITGATSGNGLKVERVDSTALNIKNSKIYGNSYGIYVNDGDNVPIELNNVEMYSNTTRGIFLVNDDDDINITNSLIRSHSVGGNSGAAISINNGSAVTISKSVIRDNTTTGAGGAIYINGSGATLTITNSVLTGNQGGNGGVISTNSGPTVTVTNSTIADNQGTNGGVFYMCTTGTTNIKNSILWNNTATGGNGANIYKNCGSGNIGTISYSDMTTSSPSIYNASFTDGGGNISPAQDPRFVDSGNDDYHLCNGTGDPDPACGATQSPAIDAGVPTVEWGRDVPNGLSSNVNWTRAMGGTSPNINNMLLKSVSVYVSGTHTSQVRFAVYSGGDLAAGPEGSTLLCDAGLTSGSATNQWLTLDCANQSITKNTPVWVAIKGNDSGFSMEYSTDSADAGDFQTDRGRFSSDGVVTPNEDTAWDTTWPINTGSFSNVWYSVYISYDSNSPSDDVDGDGRDANPDMGADEYVP